MNCIKELNSSNFQPLLAVLNLFPIFALAFGDKASNKPLNEGEMFFEILETKRQYRH
jgi:hypothetical protein